MGKLGLSKKSKAQVTALMTVTAAATPEQLGGRMTASTIAFVEGTAPAGSTITDSGSGFLKKMFKAGMKVRVSGSTSNDGVYTIVTAVAGTLTLAASTLTDELAGAAVTLTCIDDIFCKFVMLQNPESNTANIAIGDSSVDLTTGRGTVLPPLASYSREGVHLHDFWVDVGVNGEQVAIVYEEVKTPHN